MHLNGDGSSNQVNNAIQVHYQKYNKFIFLGSDSNIIRCTMIERTLVLIRLPILVKISLPIIGSISIVKTIPILKLSIPFPGIIVKLSKAIPIFKVSSIALLSPPLPVIFGPKIALEIITRVGILIIRY